MTGYQKVFAEAVNKLKEEGNYRYFLDVNKSARHFPHFYFEDAYGNRHKAVNWCSNDYLGMSVHEEVIGKMTFITHKSGTGSGGTRNLSGSTNYHKELEKTLAGLHHKESALVFGSAYLANVTTLQTLGRLFPGLVYISDEENHASIIEGIGSSNAIKVIFRHNDMFHLEQMLAALPAESPKVIVFESVYSISGTIAPIADIVALAGKYNCLTYLDEVHAVGLYGDQGGGYASQTRTETKIDIVNGTLAKGFGVLGGYIAAAGHIIDAVRSLGKGFIFTTSLPPAVCAAATKSIRIVMQDNSVRQQFHENVQRLRTALDQREIPYTRNDSHITPIIIGNPVTCKAMADELLYQHGIYVQPVNFPTVKKGAECLRIIITNKHSEKDINHLADKLQKVWQKHKHQAVRPITLAG